MADIKNEIDSLADYLEAKLVGVKCLNHMPAKYIPRQAVIQLQSSGNNLETGLHYRLERRFQIVYFGEKEIDCITNMNLLEQQLNNDMVVPLRGATEETRYLRIGSFSLSQPFKTEGGVFAIVGVLNATVREKRPQIQYDKINSVNATVKE